MEQNSKTLNVSTIDLYGINNINSYNGLIIVELHGNLMCDIDFDQKCLKLLHDYGLLIKIISVIHIT